MCQNFPARQYVRVWERVPNLFKTTYYTIYENNVLFYYFNDRKTGYKT